MIKGIITLTKQIQKNHKTNLKALTNNYKQVLPSYNNNNKSQKNYSYIQKHNFHYKNIVSKIISKMNFATNDNNNNNNNQSGNSNLSEAELRRKEKKREKNRRRRAKKKAAKADGYTNNNNNNNNKKLSSSKKRPSPRSHDATASNTNKFQRTAIVSKKKSTTTTTTTSGTNSNSRTSSTTRAAFGDKQFNSLNVVQEIKDAMSNVFYYELMTKCQEMAIPKSLEGNDVLVKAKTGTGKTLGFLIPAVNRLHLNTTAADRNGVTSVLIISPTRELASQIEAEAKQLTSFLPHLSVQCCFGGTNVKKDLSKFRKFNFPDILIGTPGRINDLLENHGLQAAMSGLNCFILDEADRLLDMGFRPDLTRMLNMLPPKNTRQTLLFSATMPNDIMNMSNFALRPNFLHIDTVGKEDQDTHKRIPQYVTVHAFDEHFPQLMHAVEEGMKVPDYKIIVFFVTARLTQLNAEVFNLMGYNVLEIHSRKSQSYRTKTSDKFRNNNNIIMFTSDVTARGMDYPDVSQVIQVGIPSDKAQYVHRIGRTGRAGKGGQGILLLSEKEDRFLNECKDLPIKPRNGAAKVEVEAYNTSKVLQALERLPSKTAAMGYQAWLGYYNSNLKRIRWDKKSLVENANLFSKQCLNLSLPPELQKKTIGKMGLKGVPGLRIGAFIPRQGGHHNRGGGGHRGGR